MERVGGLHGENAVAQLKLGYDHHSANAKFRFHGANVVAQLKRDCLRAWAAGCRGFHSEKAVAQIGATPPCRDNPDRKRFPRRQRRGPIEATRMIASPLADRLVSTEKIPWPN